MDYNNLPYYKFPKTESLPCGSIAHWDGDFSYRCENCFAVIGSIAEPERCRKMREDTKK